MDLRPPPILDVNNIVNSWEKFKAHYEVYCTAKELHLKSEKVQAAMLLNLLGEEAAELAFTLISDKNDLEDPDTIFSLLDEYVNTRCNFVYKRYLFNCRNQRTHESFEQFYEAVKELAEVCDFKHLKESIIRDRIISGIESDDLRECLLLGEYTLADVVRICSTYGEEELESKLKVVEKADIIVEKPSENCKVKRAQKKRKNKKNNSCDKVTDELSQNFETSCQKEDFEDDQDNNDAAEVGSQTTAKEKTKKLSMLEAEMGYDPLTFWKNLPTMTVVESPPEAVNKMTKKLFISLLSNRPPSEVYFKACHVASQLRSPEDLNKLIISPAAIANNTRCGNGIIGVMKDDETDGLIKCPYAAKFYQECFNNITEEFAYIWGPYFALLLLGFTKKCVIYAMDLPDYLTYFYEDFETFFCPNFEDDLLLAYTDHLTNLAVSPVQYNTIMYGLISAYSRGGSSPQLAGIFDFLTLPSLNFNGMDLFVLVGELTKYFKCFPRELASEYCFPQCSASWEGFFLFEEKCYDQLLTDKLWGFARNFSSTAFAKLSYMNNYFLCHLLALHHDMIFRAWSFSRCNFYQNLLILGSNCPVSIRDYNDSMLAFNKLQSKGSFKMGSKETSKRLRKAEKLVNQVEVDCYHSAYNENSSLPPLLPKDINYVILTHIELEKKYHCKGCFTPLKKSFVEGLKCLKNIL